MNRTKIMAMAAIGVMIASGLLFFIPDHQGVPLKADTSTITGSTYSGHGNWAIGVATVYTSQTATIYGSIYINGSGSLTLISSTLTMDESGLGVVAINVNAGFFRMSHSTLTVSNDTSAMPLVQTSGLNELSNSTLKHIRVYSSASGGGTYVDNCTMDSSIIEFDYGSGAATGMNLTNNRFHNVTNGWVMTGFPNNSTINGNTIYSDCIQTFTSGYFGWIAVIAQSAGNSANTLITNNHIEATVHVAGVYVNIANRVDIIGNTIDKVNRNWNASDHTFSICAGVVLYGVGRSSAGSWSNVNYNIFKAVDTSTRLNGSHLYGPIGFNVGIAGSTYAKYWNINHNQFWYVGGAGNTGAFGIDYEGSHATIDHNNISAVRCQQGPAFYGNGAGIIVQNDFNEIYNTGYWSVLNAENCEYVNVTWNTITSTWSSSNAITVGWSYIGGNVTKGIVSNNTIGDLQFSSVGIGIYVHVNHILVADNTITSVKVDSLGISLCRDATYIVVIRNSIHVVDQVTGSGFPEEYTGAISLNAEYFDNNGRDSVISYNHIVVDNRIISGASWIYPDYCISNSSIATTGHELIIILDEPATMKYYSSHFYVIGDVGKVYQLVFSLDGQEPTSSFSNGISQWDPGVLSDEFHTLVVSKTYDPTTNQLLNLILVFFALIIAMSVVGFALKAKEKGIEHDDIIELVVFIVIGLVLMGILVVILGS